MDNLLDDLLNLGTECPTPQYDAIISKLSKHPDCTPEFLSKIKSCVNRGDNWLFAGADFSALEERIGAILSKDPNRIKVYTDGFDGHSMRTYRYFKDQMPDIVEAIEKAKTATKFWIDDKGEYCCE